VSDRNPDRRPTSSPKGEDSVAVLYQAAPAPAVDGIAKPFKAGGYRDSGADIAFGLRQRGTGVVTPIDDPRAERDLDWVFPDDASGIAAALDRGANVLWANTVLHSQHALCQIDPKSATVIGQRPEDVERYDDKHLTNETLRAEGVPVAAAVTYRRGAELGPALGERMVEADLQRPWVIKPIRGRGSQGVTVAQNLRELAEALEALTTARDPSSGSRLYGDAAIIESFLPGEEITVTVLPPGRYPGHEVHREHWSLPPVRRFNHRDGIAPYSGDVRVVENSAVIPQADRDSHLATISTACATAGKILDTVAPIRIDCRADAAGVFKIFDVNLKPNMTGPGRPRREDQDSLMLIAAQDLGWDYGDLLSSVLSNSRIG